MMILQFNSDRGDTSLIASILVGVTLGSGEAITVIITVIITITLETCIRVWTFYRSAMSFPFSSCEMNNRDDSAVFVSDHREIRRVVTPLLEEY